MTTPSESSTAVDGPIPAVPPSWMIVGVKALLRMKGTFAPHASSGLRALGIGSGYYELTVARIDTAMRRVEFSEHLGVWYNWGDLYPVRVPGERPHAAAPAPRDLSDAVLESLVLKPGQHVWKEEQDWKPGAPLPEMCITELVSFMAGEPFSDTPDCVSPVFTGFLRPANDNLTDAERQRLKPYWRKLMNSHGDAAEEERRSWMCLDWLVREEFPMWHDLVMTEDAAQSAESLRTLQPIQDEKSLVAAVRQFNKTYAGVGGRSTFARKYEETAEHPEVPEALLAGKDWLKALVAGTEAAWVAAAPGTGRDGQHVALKAWSLWGEWGKEVLLEGAVYQVAGADKYAEVRAAAVDRFLAFLDRLVDSSRRTPLWAEEGIGALVRQHAAAVERVRTAAATAVERKGAAAIANAEGVVLDERRRLERTRVGREKEAASIDHQRAVVLLSQDAIHPTNAATRSRLVKAYLEAKGRLAAATAANDASNEEATRRGIEAFEMQRREEAEVQAAEKDSYAAHAWLREASLALAEAAAIENTVEVVPEEPVVAGDGPVPAAQEKTTPVQKWKKRPIVIEAIQWLGDNFEEVMAFAGDNVKVMDPEAKTLGILTLANGWVPSPVGEWVLRGISGEFYPCADSVLKASYDLVEHLGASVQPGALAVRTDLG